MTKIDNINIAGQKLLSSPAEIIKENPASQQVTEFIAKSRQEVIDILERRDNRKIMIVGPCSIHNEQEALEFAANIKSIQDKVSDKILLVMRVYFEKPRTTVGWKGLIYDPDLNDSYNFDKGLRLARKILLDVAEMGVPAATELLDPIITQYIADLVSWGAIGARTTESQTHRQMVSGVSMPIGFKNATNGNLTVAVDAIKSASHPHSFLGVLQDGRTGIFQTNGNPHCHVVLRGGSDGPNFGSEYTAFTREVMKKAGLTPNIIVDCSHANSGKDPMKQPNVMHDLLKQIGEGNNDIVGFMLESNLFSGNQKVVEGQPLKPGISITDGCLGWEETANLINEMYQSL